jgi:capsular polysaccharide transport system permease protein
MSRSAQLAGYLTSGRGLLPSAQLRQIWRDVRTAAHELVGPLKIQGRVLLALMLREARTRYGRQKFGYLWALIEPILHIVLFYGIFQYTLRVVPLGHSLPMFLATGLATYVGFANVMNRTQGGFASNEALLAYPIVSVMDVFLGRALLELTTWVAVTFIIIGGLIASGIDPLPHSVLTMGAAILLLFGIGFGVGVLIGIAAQFAPSVDNLLSVPLRLLYFTSGAFFLPDMMPPAVRDILAWNPILQGVTLFRMGYYSNYNSHILDMKYLILWSAVAVLAAFLVERLTRKALLSRSF